MSHDTDKLIRQLSLVAFLMAERRPLTARDVKSNVEGYSEMSDEAFARRFYSDRAELVALGVPLQSQRDEFTGEELYTLRSEQYFLPSLDLSDEELAALFRPRSTLLDGNFAYAEPLRLALQNLALGRPRLPRAAEPPPRRSVRRARSRLLPGDAGPARQARERDLEAADGQVPLLVDLDGQRGRADAEPVRAVARRHRLVRGRPRPRPRRTSAPSASRASAATSASRPGASATSDPARLRHRALPRPRGLAARRHPRRGAHRGARTTPPGGSSARSATAAGSRTGSSSPSTPRSSSSPRGSFARTDAPCRSSPTGSAATSPRRSSACARHIRGRPTSRHRRHRAACTSPPPSVRPGRSPRSASASCRRCSRTCSPRAARAARRRSDAHKLAERLPASLPRQLEEHLSLLNLVNFGGGCYAVYAELDGDQVHVDKELYGDTFRHAAAPDAARGARDPARARVRRADDRRRARTRPLDRVRAKLEETFGAVRARTGGRAAASVDETEEDIVAVARARRERAPAGRVRVPEGRPRSRPRRRLVEPYSLERDLPYWRVHTWDRASDGPRTFRLDRMQGRAPPEGDVRAADRLRPPGLPGRGHGTRPLRRRRARPARCRARGATLLATAAPLAELKFGSKEWLVGEVLS